MLAASLLETPPLWLAGDAPEAETAVLSMCTLSRNLSDFPFTDRCAEADKASIENRVVAALDGLSLLSTGQYYRLPELDPREIRFLAERRLITQELATASGPRGVYVADDQTFCIMVNGEDHVTTRGMLSGLQLQEIWARLNLMDDTLAGVLDFAFDEDHGHLTAGLDSVGTGLHASVLLHLPAWSMDCGGDESPWNDAHVSCAGIRAGGRNVRAHHPAQSESRTSSPAPDVMFQGVETQLQAEQAVYSDLCGLCRGPRSETLGDLFVLSHQGTLGMPEDELVYRVRKAAANLAGLERKARKDLQTNSPWYLEDRVGRARGLAAGVHVLSFSEALSILSSLRMGVPLGLVPGHGIQAMNEVLLATQGAHLEVAKGAPCDLFELSRARAALFRARFD